MRRVDPSAPSPMKHLPLLPVLALSSWLLASSNASAQCAGGSTPCHVLPGNPIVADGVGPVPGPWLSGHTYMVEGSLSIPAGQTLTIQPGAIVKFDTSSAGIGGPGVLDARGSSGQPIVFTSYEDDSAGGDHNGDGPSSGAKGQWNDLVLSHADSVLEHCEVRFAGSFNAPAIQMTAPDIRLANVRVRDCAGDGLDLNHWLCERVEDCHFENCDAPIVDLNPPGSNRLWGNTSANNLEGESLRVSELNFMQLNWTTTILADNTLNGNGAIVFSRSYEIGPNGHLILGAGVVLKFSADDTFQTTSDGRLTCNGSALAPVVFTSEHDDDYGGDSNADGDTDGAPGDWKGIWLTGGAVGSLLDHVVVRYSGGDSGVRISANGCQVLHTTIEHSTHDGLAPVADTVVQDCTFHANGGYPIGSVALSQLGNFTGNAASGNASGDVLRLGTSTVSDSVSIDPSSAFNGSNTFLWAGNWTVGGSATLSLQPGVILKADPSVKPAMTIHGTALFGAAGGAPVSITSLHDDSIGGDIGGDGASTAPAPGDWKWIYLGFNADASVLENLQLHYGGASGNAAVRVDGADIELRDSTIAHSFEDGLDCNGASFAVQGCSFVANGGRAVVDAHLQNVAGFSGNSASGNGGGDVLWVQGNGFAAPTVVQAANAFDGTGVFAVEGVLSTLSNPGSLSLEAGVILKFAPGGEVRVGASPLWCNGSAAAPVVFTSLDDDAHGGDSTGNGPTQGSPGDWRGFDFFLSPDAVLDHVLVRYAGEGGIGALRTEASSPTVSNSTFEHCAGAGMDLSGGDCAITNCHFRACSLPFENVSLSGLSLSSANTAVDSTLADVAFCNRRGGLLQIDLGRANTLNDNGVIVLTGDPDLQANQSLQLGPGLVLKLQGARRLQFQGVLSAAGAFDDRIVLTSVHDPEHGPEYVDLGQPAGKGDWIGMAFESTADQSVLQDVLVRYAGAQGAAAIELQNCTVSFCRVTVEQTAGHAIDTNENSVPILKDCQLNDNDGKAIEGVTWPVLGNMQGTTATGNGVSDGATVITSSFVEGELWIEQGSYFGEAIVVEVSPITNTSTNTLSFGRGVIVKCHAGVRIHARHVRGTGLEKVVFTSFHDDSKGGDSNGNQSETLPQPGDWDGLSVGNPTDTSWGSCEHVLVRYGGGGPAPQSGLPNSLSTPVEWARYSRAEHSLYNGMAGVNFESCVAYKNGAHGIRGFEVRHCTAADNMEEGIHAGLRALYCVSWLNGPSGAENYTYTTDHVIGVEGTDVAWSCGTDITVGAGMGFQGNCGSTGWENVNVDPRFEDLSAGDLRLRSDSPVLNYFVNSCPPLILGDNSICKPWAPTGQNYEEPAPSPRDHDEFPRLLDQDFDGLAPRLADLGAHEYAPNRLTLTAGEPVIGTDVWVNVIGEPGFAIHLVGFQGEVWIPGVGYLLLDPAQYFTTLAVDVVGAPQKVPIPADTNLLGQELVFTAIAFPNPPGLVFNATNVWRPLFRL